MSSENLFIEECKKIYQTFISPIEDENKNLRKQNEQLKTYVLTLTQQLDELKRFDELSIIAQLHRENDDLKSENTVLSKRVKILTCSEEPKLITLESGNYYLNNQNILFHDKELTSEANILKKITLKNGDEFLLDSTDQSFYHITDEGITGTLAGKIVNKKAKLF